MKEIAKLSPTVAHSYLLAILLPILERNVPLKKFSSKKRSKWARKRNVLWRKLKKVKDLLTRAFSIRKILVLLDRRNKLQKELNKMYDSQNQEAEAKVIEAMKTNPNEFFRYAKARQKTKSSIGPLLDSSSGRLNSDPSFAAEALSQQYSRVFTLPRPEWSIPDVRKFFSVEESVSSSHMLANLEFDPDFIEVACAELKGTSAPGPDGIPAILLKECKQELKLPLFYLWKESFNQGIIPPDLLLVQICPIHKGGSKADPGQYRPVALTSHLIKVFERVIRRVLVEFLESSDQLPENQHGFREKRSTLTQLLAHWDQVIDLLEQGLTVDVIYTDFAKAFDKCETNVLLHTLKKCGVKGKFGEWIAAFLDSSTRTQYVGVDGSLSSPQSVISGVPQGTVLGPVLFLVHIMNLCSGISPETNSSSFADDTKIWRGIKDVQDCESLQKDLSSVYQAAAHINMDFNSKKFEWLRYAPSSTVASTQYIYSAPDSSNITLKTEL